MFNTKNVAYHALIRKEEEEGLEKEGKGERVLLERKGLGIVGGMVGKEGSILLGMERAMGRGFVGVKGSREFWDG